MEQMITANIALDIFAVVLSLIPVVYLISYKRYKKQMNRYFLGVSVSNMLMIIGDIADWIFPNPATSAERLTVLAFSALFYTASAFVLYFFYRYLSDYLELNDSTQKITHIAVISVCAVQVFFALISPFTGAVFYVTDEGYQRGPLFIISQLVPLFCYILFTALVIAYRKKLKRREIIFFLLYIFVPLGGGAVQMFTRGIAVVNIGVALALLFILVNIQFEYDIALQEQERKLTEQRIDLMLSQIQPHFLYNSLGAIYRLCEVDSDKARLAIQKFSNYLRGNMDSLKNRSPITFEKELEHVKNYLYLEQQRYGDLLRVVYNIETDNFFIPALTLQPIVENAVQHGLFHKREGGTVIISTKDSGEYTVVTVADDGIGIERAKKVSQLGDHTHIGISNVRSRLEETVGGSLEIESSDNGTTVTIRIPRKERF